MIHKSQRSGNAETFLATHVLIEASLMNGGFVECPITVELSTTAEDALASSRDEMEFVTRLLHLMKGEHARAVERCELSDAESTAAFRLSREALGAMTAGDWDPNA